MRVLDAAVAPEQAVALLRRSSEPTVFFDGRGGLEGAWPCRVVVAPRRLANDLEGAFAVIARRRARGGPGGTGVVLALSYEGGVTARTADASITFLGDETVAAGDRALLDDAERRLTARPSPRVPAGRQRPTAGPTTSLPLSGYLAAVRRIQDHIARGDIYQANLTQRFTCGYAGDPWDLFTELARTSPAPRSAFLEVEGEALVSMSPEVFVDVDAKGHAETRPIKGTRARHADPAKDRAAASELLRSTKDRAELVMIVDLERNDLGRVAKIGSVRVSELGALRSYPAVHHLVARVEAELRDDVSPRELIRAIFPGGSITGAPKKRAMEIIAAIEPVPRGLYTGSLFWFDDDGSMLSSILIRSAIVTGGLAHVGAGGGIVADSEAEAEWAESNAKARAITRALGFEPEEAS
jgi:aminodeoxychorismate synthase component I